MRIINKYYKWHFKIEKRSQYNFYNSYKLRLCYTSALNKIRFVWKSLANNTRVLNPIFFCPKPNFLYYLIFIFKTHILSQKTRFVGPLIQKMKKVLYNILYYKKYFRLNVKNGFQENFKI